MHTLARRLSFRDLVRTGIEGSVAGAAAGGDRGPALNHAAPPVPPTWVRAAERDSAIAQLRREAVDLAIAGAGRVIEKNLDSAQNRRLVEEFLSGLDAKTVKS